MGLRSDGKDEQMKRSCHGKCWNCKYRNGYGGCHGTYEKKEGGK